MSTIDSRYIQATILQHVFRDKDTGLPLSDGEIWFYRDTDRIALKSVYMFSGTPDPEFTELPNPMPLTGIGTASDGFTNDILFYYLPEDADGNIDRYFIEVYASPGKLLGGVLQFTREAQPTISEEDTTDDNFINYVNNGQFLIHTDFPNSGEIIQSVTDVAYGGWTWERPESSTATDLITFERFGSFIEQPESNPRYAIRCNTTVPDPSDLFKDLRWKVSDVNFFASETEELTLQIEAQSNTGGPINVELIIIKNFGTGGSATTETPVTTFVLEPGYQKFPVTFTMGDTDGETIGNLDDDFIQFAFRFSSSLIIDVSITNVMIRDGDYNLLVAPIQSYAQQQEEVLGGSLPIPTYVGSDVGKAVVLTKSGYEYSSSSVGRGVITGCTVENDVSDPLLHIKFNPGIAHSDTEIFIKLDTPIVKEIEFPWEEGTNMGGLGTGIVAADTTYHLFLILKEDFLTVDAYFDPDVNAANIPTDYIHFVRVASLKTDGNGDLYQFIQDPNYPDIFTFKRALLFEIDPLIIAGEILDIGLPHGITFSAQISINLTNETISSGMYFLLTSIFQDDFAPTLQENTIHINNTIAGQAGQTGNSSIDILTDENSSIRHRSNTATAGSNARLHIVSWRDNRGNI